MTSLHIALVMAFLSALLFALSQFTYVVGTFSTIGAAIAGTYYYFVKDDDKLEGSTT